MGQCKYSVYGNRCKNTFVNTDGVCEKHSKEKCWCGKQAVEGCSMELQFVCGRPLCEEHADRCPAHGGAKPEEPKGKEAIKRMQFESVVEILARGLHLHEEPSPKNITAEAIDYHAQRQWIDKLSTNSIFNARVMSMAAAITRVFEEE